MFVIDSINTIDTEKMGALDPNDGITEVNHNFYVKYDPQIRAIVARILLSAGQARDIDDCVNDVYLALMEKLDRYSETRGSMGAFVTVIARSTALHHCRDNRHRLDELVGDGELDCLVGDMEVENKVEFQLLVDGILDKLNEQENALFVLRFLLFHSPEEIAKSLNINRNAVDARICRLKNKVRKLLIKGGITP